MTVSEVRAFIQCTKSWSH